MRGGSWGFEKAVRLYLTIGDEEGGPKITIVSLTLEAALKLLAGGRTRIGSVMYRLRAVLQMPWLRLHYKDAS